MNASGVARLNQLREMVFSTAQLYERGMSKRQVQRAVETRHIVRIRRGWYCYPDTPHEIQLAVNVGGRVTGHSLFRLMLAWVPTDERIHLALKDGAKPFPAHSSRFLVSWSRDEPVALRPFATLVSALKHMVAKHSVEYSVTVIDSLLYKQLVTYELIADTLGKTASGRQVLGSIDGRAESGGESMVRLRLRSHRIRVTPQVVISGVGRVDLVVGDRLVIEVDGYEHHRDREAFERDRYRDRLLRDCGYLVVRITYRQIDDEWDEILQQILRVVRSRQHRWRSQHR